MASRKLAMQQAWRSGQRAAQDGWGRFAVCGAAWACGAWLCAAAFSARAGEPAASAPTAAERGYQFLTTHPLQPDDLTAEEFQDLWKVWPEPQRGEAERASADERRRMLFSR
jgi:hypothetical protein